MALSVKHGLSVHQVDVTTAFLNGTIEDEVYMQQPKGFKCQGKEEFVCKLNKSIYVTNPCSNTQRTHKNRAHKTTKSASQDYKEGHN